MQECIWREPDVTYPKKSNKTFIELHRAQSNDSVIKQTRTQKFL